MTGFQRINGSGSRELYRAFPSTGMKYVQGFRKDGQLNLWAENNGEMPEGGLYGFKHH